MTSKKVRRNMLWLFAISAIIALGGYILSHPTVFGLDKYLCRWYSFKGASKCYEIYQLSIGQPLYFGLPYISFTFLVLIALPQTYQTWKRFAVWALPIMVGIVAMTPVYGESFGPLPARDTMAVFVAKIFLVVSVSIIIYTLWKHNGSGSNASG